MAAEKVEESATGKWVKKKAMVVTMKHGRKQVAGGTLY
jgi:hypothetical protein